MLYNSKCWHVKIYMLVPFSSSSCDCNSLFSPHAIHCSLYCFVCSVTTVSWEAFILTLSCSYCLYFCTLLSQRCFLLVVLALDAMPLYLFILCYYIILATKQIYIIWTTCLALHYKRNWRFSDIKCCISSYYIETDYIKQKT
jgi:hypothetical protein